ncbi:MAG TPA: hypothetical protein VIV66_13190 [Pyrinomonadaceae bacterium]
MKKGNLFGAAAMLTLVLSFPVFAGDVQTPTITPPPPPSANATGTTDTTSDPASGVATSLDYLLELLFHAF